MRKNKLPKGFYVNPSAQAITAYLADPELIPFILAFLPHLNRLRLKAILKKLEKNLITDPSRDHYVKLGDTNAGIGVNTATWTLWICGTRGSIFFAPDWKKTTYDFE